MGLFTKKKVIYFLHIYKTGGTSLNDMFHRNYREGEIINLYGPEGSTAEHKALMKVHDLLKLQKKTRIVYGHYTYGIHRYSKRPFEYMSILRDPLARMASSYYHLKRLEPWWQLRILQSLDPSFKTEEDVKANFPTLETHLTYTGIQNQQCMFLTGDSPYEINKDQEAYAQKAIENIKRDFGFVGITEKYDACSKALSQKLGLHTTKFEYKNLGHNKPRVLENKSKAVEIVNSLSKADRIIYDYVVETFYS